MCNGTCVTDDHPRRRLLQLAGAGLLTGLAGCGAPLPFGSETPGDETATPEAPPTDATATTAQTPTDTLTPTGTATATDTATSTRTRTPATATPDTATSTRTRTPSSTPTPTPTATAAPSGRSASASFGADEGAADGAFGRSLTVSPDGSRALVGAPDDGAGAVHVFERTNVNWTQRTRITLSDGTSGDRFGAAVTLSPEGDRAIVGAPGRNDGAGAAYVLQRQGGVWAESATLTPEEQTGGLGAAVALEPQSETVLVGAPGRAGDSASSAGSAHVFVYAGGWRQRGSLAATDGTAGDRFGESAALIDAETAVLGAPGADAGAVSVFRRTDTEWEERETVPAPDGTASAGFGADVAVSPERSAMYVGAPAEDTDGGAGAGAVHVYVRDARMWNLERTLTAAGADADDALGETVASTTDGRTVLAGAPGEQNRAGDGAGAAYQFRRADGRWRQQAKLLADVDASDRFGAGLALTPGADTALLGAPGDEDPNGDGAGAAYVFRSP